MTPTVEDASTHKMAGAIDIRTAQRHAVLLGTVGALAVLASHVVLWGIPSPRKALEESLDWWMPFLIPLIALAAIPLHEGLHYVGFRLAGATREQIHFGVDPQVGPYCGCTAPLRLRRYIVAIILPVLVLGVLPWVLGMITGRLALTAFGAIQVLLAGGDFLALRLAVGQTGNPWVQDTETGIGFEVHPDEPPGTATPRRTPH
jgi:hypothetical protein